MNNLSFLSDANNIGYGPLPIPAARDHEITDALRAWVALSKPERYKSAKAFSDASYYRTLECYSVRMASLAARTRNQEFIFYGLLALGLHGQLEPWGISVAIVSLHYDASERIGVNARSVFEQAAALLPDRAAEGIRGYLTLSADQKSIELMAYHTTTNGDGFRYERDIDPLAAMRKRRSKDNHQ